MNEPELTVEERVLRMMKRVLTNVAKDTAPKPGRPHNLLSENTIQGIRECLALITTREQELGKQFNRDMSARPRYVDEPRTEVVVPLDVENLKAPSPNKDE